MIKPNKLNKSNKPNFFLNLKSYPVRTKREIRLIDKNPWGDKDKDKVPNIFDCKPLDKKKQAWNANTQQNLIRQKPMGPNGVGDPDENINVKKSLNP